MLLCRQCNFRFLLGNTMTPGWLRFRKNIWVWIKKVRIVAKTSIFRYFWEFCFSDCAETCSWEYRERKWSDHQSAILRRANRRKNFCYRWSIYARLVLIVKIWNLLLRESRSSFKPGGPWLGTARPLRFDLGVSQKKSFRFSASSYRN